jgi:hypothetical protein
MALYDKQPYDYVMLAMTFHPLNYLYEWSFTLQIGFKERFIVVYLKQIQLFQET